MSQTTSALWKELLALPGTERQYGFEIGGVWYGPEAEVTHTVSSELFSEFGIGNASCAELTLGLYAGNIPRAARIERFVRLVNGERVSEWLPKGVFFANRRVCEEGYWTVEAYDAMRKGDAVWTPDQTLAFPLPMTEAAAEFARILEVPLDPRCPLNAAYTIDYPANDYTVRDELCFIAAAHGGNWIISDEGKLLLLPLRSAPAPGGCLVTRRGEPITFGGVRILV